MFIRKKSIAVIGFSCAIISIVLTATLAGYIFYIQWKNDSFAVEYKNAISRLTAQIYRKDIVISNISIGADSSASSPGILSVEANIRNNSVKSVTSLILEVSFKLKDGSILYRDRFYPFGEYSLNNAPFSSTVYRQKNVLLRGDSVTFRHQLPHCPKRVVHRILKNSKLSQFPLKDEIELNISIEGMSVL